jgi:LAO/AO transport system kinase
MPQRAKPMSSGTRRLAVSAYVEGVLAHDPIVLARAITLVESDLPADAEAAAAVLDAVLPSTGRARRVGITGVPGVGKSTFIDALGIYLVRERGERVAVLSIDPSSQLTRGSILGDKVRMERLALEPRAFIRPSPARGHAGGVARRTREAMLLCEAAGYDHVLVETVGVGQTETAVRSMTDFFLLLMLAGAGDELQGIKRGILEMVDAMAVTKADADNVGRAERARAEYAGALRLFPPSSDGWTPRVLTCSAFDGRGIDDVWQAVLDHHAQQTASGALASRRRVQAVEWMHELVAGGLQELWRKDAAVTARLSQLEDAVREGRTSAFAAARDAIALIRA